MRNRCLWKAIQKINRTLEYAKDVGGVAHRHYSSEAKLKWSYKHGDSSVPFVGITIGKKLQETVEKSPQKEAHIFCRDNVRINFESLLEESDQLAAGLMNMGIQRGERVGIWAPNIPQWVIAQYATARAGIILVNINPAYQTMELEYALKKVGVKAIIAAESFKTQNYYAMLREICPELDTATPGDLCAKKLPELKTVIMISDKAFNGAFTYDEVLSAATNEKRSYIWDLQDKLQFDDPINIQFTSGTTGSPKGATLTHHNIMNNSRFIGLNLDYHVKDSRICMPVPLYHCFGMVIGSLMSINYAATIVYPSPSFEPEAALQAVHHERCTALYGTPTMFIDMLDSHNLDNYDLTSLYTGVMAGSPCPVEVMKQTMTKLHMPQVTIAYGTTENSPVTFQGHMDDPLERKTSTIGQPHPYVEAKIVNENGDIVRIGEKGELCIRGYVVMLNYWQDAEKTLEAIGDDRWYKTGDVAVMDEDGYAQIVGRIKDLIIRGGENIYPVEIENLLYQHPDVSDVQVIGVPDARLGEQVCACIKLREGHKVTEQDIKDFCKGKIAHFKIPHYVKFVAEFPLTVTGKVQKYKMRQHFAESLRDN